MKNCTPLKYLLLSTVLLSLNFAFGQDFNIQHLSRDVPRTGATSSITAVSSLNNAFVINNNNRKAQAGRSDLNANDLAGRDLSGAVRLTATNTLTYYRESNSVNSNTRFDASVWEYTGTPGGANEFIVRGRYIVNLNGTSNNVTQAVSGVTNANKCVPFITGIISNSSSPHADSGSTIAYLENSSTMRVQKGSNANNVFVYITLVEFTGSNWTILHGDSGGVNSDTGNITLRSNSDGTGTATNVSSWNNALIITHSRGNMNDSGVDQAIADNWPLTRPGFNNQTVAWEFNTNHDGQPNGDRHFVHVLNNPEININRFNNTSSSAGQTTIDITSASLSSLNQSLIIGTSITSGGGMAYARGWRNYYLNSTTQAAHWAHRSGNTMSHEVQIIDVSAAGAPPSYCASNGNSTADEYIGRVQLNTINNSSGIGTTGTGYSDFTAINTDLDLNGNYTITITPTWTGTAYPEGYSVWIDYNQNGDFTDPGEQIFTAGPTTTSPVSGSFTVPATALIGSTRMRISMSWNAIPNSCGSFQYGEVEDYTVNIISSNPQQEIEITGNSIEIVNNDITPSILDNTDFGDVPFPTGNKANSFVITNLGGVNNLNLTGSAPYVNISGAHALDFIVTSAPVTPIAAGNNTSFVITFTPSALGLRTATISIANNDADENPYVFNIQGTGIVPPPCGSTVIHSANFETNNDGWTLGGSDASRLNNSSRAYSNNHSIRLRNTGWMSLTGLDFDGYDKIDIEFFFYAEGMESPKQFVVEYRENSSSSWQSVAPYVSNGATLSKTGDFINGRFHAKTATLLRSDFTFPTLATAEIRIINQGTDTSDIIYLDMFSITGTTYCVPTLAPGGVSTGLDLWLKADMVDGNTVGSDGSLVNVWTDNGKGNHAKALVTGKAPIYRNSEIRNFNFNPVLDFENVTNDSGSDMTYLVPNKQELKGTGGFNSNDVFVVLMPDPTITSTMPVPLDAFTSTDPSGQTYTEDVTGFGFGTFTARFANERLTYCIGTTNETGGGSAYPGNGYGRADTNSGTNYNQIGIVNFRHNNTSSPDNMNLYFNAIDVGNEDNAPAQFAEINNTRYWLGRSQYWDASFDGRIAEVITYAVTNDDSDNTRERNRIQSYLAVKYGITLGVNGVSQDYADSNGTIIWDADAENYNYDIAGIGKDDASELEQKQSRSVNDNSDGIGRTRGILTVGLTEIYDTNHDNKTLNATTLNDREFLMWGDNGADLNSAAATIMVDMSASIPGLSTEVSFTAMQRVWKFVETGGDVPTVKVRIPQNAIRNISPPGSYYMFISDTGVFDPTAAYTLMVDDGNGNLETTYDFDGTKYITFGYAPQIEVVRSIYFNGTTDFIDMEDKVNLNPAGFTISAWVKRDASDSGISSITSKRDAAFSQGYDLRFLNDNRIEIVWRNGGFQSLISNTSIPNDEWHHVAVIYNGATVRIYIDGILDNSASRIPPLASNEYFYIAAAAKNTPVQHFRGNIDEVRIWETALTESQLRFIMNQEIEENTTFTNGTIVPTSITKYDIGVVPWNRLAAYYPMSIYTYTNTDDASGNGNQGALRNLRTVDFQTAPLPYISENSGDWNDNSTWLNGNVQYIPGSNSIVDPKETVDWNIVIANHNITMENTSIHPSKNNLRSLLSLDLQNSGVLILEGDTSINEGNGLLVTHYLKLDGVIDLEGESQLVQNIDSDFDPASSGRLERDQQGTADVFTYNYWSSPVGTRNSTTNNNSFTVPTVLQDGNNPINFISSGFNGSNTTPIGIADFWIWKFANQPTGQYSAWQHVRSTGSILAGEGFTMKGPGTGAVIDDQNYVFNGKPNNGDINLTLAANNDYLVGNPYPSALNAEQFILDNGPAGTNSLSGTLYFWEHWGGGSHILQQYQGGYATFNLSGGSPSANQGTNHPDVGMGGTPRKTPGLYIPVSQGFFVTAAGSGGTINFNNSQRIFEKEDGNLLGTSVFMRSFNENYYRIVENENDSRMKFRIGFKSVNEIQRQLLLTIDEKATVNEDWGYDAILNETQIDDMYWLIEDENFIIQGSDVLDEFVRYPVGIKLANPGMNEIGINVLENVPLDIAIYVHDKDLDYYHNLNQSPYEFHSMAGEHLNRFDILFNKEDAALSVGDDEFKSLNAVYANNNESIILINPTLIEVKSMELLNVIGQTVTTINNISVSGYSEYEVKNLSSGTYIIKINTVSGSVSKKVLVD
jgi:hypothetical protein